MCIALLVQPRMDLARGQMMMMVMVLVTVLVMVMVMMNSPDI